jgi:hypothetical protein
MSLATVLPYFQGRTLWIATMHRKEEVIAPVLAPLQVHVAVPELNTDQLGTFSREVARPGDQRQTARRKAELALERTGGDLALASEGAFLPHPQMPWIPVNRELVILVDRRYDLELTAEVTSTETNYASRQIRTWEAACTFAQQVKFPEHGLILMPHSQPRPGDPIHKGIRTWETLETLVQEGLATWGSLHLETDMRAHHNPTRMQVIGEACRKLLERITSLCPRCQSLGFGEVQYLSGLPCADCGTPTSLRAAVLWACPKCHYTEKRLIPGQPPTADPTYCPVCNP